MMDPSEIAERQIELLINEKRQLKIITQALFRIITQQQKIADLEGYPFPTPPFGEQITADMINSTLKTLGDHLDILESKDKG